MSFKIDWGGLIVDIVKKKDLDGFEFANCWEENYDWTELDKFVIENYKKLLIAYGEVEKDRLKIKVNLEKDLNKYIGENLK